MNQRRLQLLALAAVSAAALAGLPGLLSRAAAQGRTLTVYAAASLSDAFNEIGASFEQRHPGWKVRFNFGASSTLRTQIEQGAPADLFASADWAQMQPLVDARTVESPRTFARNRLVIVVPARNPGHIRSPLDLARPGLRVVATAESVPVGRYTQEVLRKLARRIDYPDDFSEAVNRNVVSRESNVRAVLAKVELGEADAGIVYETDVRSSRRARTVELPTSTNVTATYPIAEVAGTPNAEGAQAFVRFVAQGEGQSILRRHGFR